MAAISHHEPKEGGLLALYRYIASRIYPAVFADCAVYKARSGNLEKRHSEQAREIQSLRDERELLLDMIDTKDERLAQLASDNERLERELSAALEARARAQQQRRIVLDQRNSLYEHIEQTRRSKRRRGR